MWASLVAEEKKVFKIKKENSDEHTLPAAEAEEDGISYISPGNLFFDVVLSMNHVALHFQLFMPTRLVTQLPMTRVPVVLSHGTKTWNLFYMGRGVVKRPRFDIEWRRFVVENHLKLGDVCVFELLENTVTKLRFKVHILRTDDLPMELFVPNGTTLETAICIDDD